MLTQGATRRYGRGEYPPEHEIRALVRAGLNDTQIGQRYQRSNVWVWNLRLRYGIAAVPPSYFRPPEAELRAFVSQGLRDKAIGEHYGRSKKWIERVRAMYGIRAAFPSHRKGRVTKAVPPPPAPPPEPAPEPPAPRDSYAAYFAEHGRYPSFTDAQIARYERRWALAHPKRAPAVIDVAPTLYGDPKPGRAA